MVRSLLRSVSALALIALSPFGSMVHAQPGSVDLSFDPGTGTNDRILDMLVQPDGKIVIVGPFTEYNGTACNHIARLLPDGTLDPSFMTGSAFDEQVYKVERYNDGRLLVCGQFNTYNGSPIVRMARLMADGTFDPSFSAGTDFGIPPNQWINDLAIAPDEKIYIRGSFQEIHGAPTYELARLEASGQLDPSFDLGTSVFDNLRGLAVQPDGKLVVGGEQEMEFHGIERNGLARFNIDGSLDMSFDPGAGFTEGFLNTLSLLPDGRILVGGSIEEFAGEARFGIAIIQADGALDMSFGEGAQGMLPNSSVVYTVAYQPNGKVVAAGSFQQFDGLFRRSLARTEDNGLVDHAFQTGTGFTGGSSTVFTVEWLPDGTIMAAGDFTTVNDVPRNNIVRLIGVDAIGMDELHPLHVSVFPNPSQGTLSIVGDMKEAYTLEVRDALGRAVTERFVSTYGTVNQTMDLSALEPGNYVVLVSGATGTKAVPFILQ
ncbi:MAG: T9SS type A sorting domain-containing protein [Flavobacteriales bacterium]|nr:T9SS type A sorting domain-containing protein [Flavobacteriales bacterium]